MDSTSKLIQLTPGAAITPQDYEEYQEVSRMMAEEAIEGTPDPTPADLLVGMADQRASCYALTFGFGRMALTVKAPVNRDGLNSLYWLVETSARGARLPVIYTIREVDAEGRELAVVDHASCEPS